MAWVRNDTIQAWVWDAGPYLPGGSVRPNAPHHSLIEGIDCGDIDYIVIDASFDPATFNYGNCRYDCWIYQYDAGGTNGWEVSTSSDRSTTAPTTPHLYVAFYNFAFDDAVDFFPDVADGMTLVPPSYCTGGLAPDPVAPANDDWTAAVTLPSTRSGSFDLPANMEWATVDSTEYDLGGSVYHFPYDGTTVWYKFIPPVSGDYLFTVPNVGTYDAENPAAWIYGYRENDHPGVHPATYDSAFSNNTTTTAYGTHHRDKCPMVGLVGGETIWLQIDTAEFYSAHITWVGPPAPVWVEHTYYGAWVAHLGSYGGTEWPPRPFSLNSWPSDAAEIDFQALGKKTDGSVIAATDIRFSNNSNGSGGYVPSGDGYAYWRNEIGASVFYKSTYVRNNPTEALPPGTELYAVWYMPNYDDPDPLVPPSLTPLQLVTPEQIGDGTATSSPPPNDDFANRIVLTGASGSFTVDNTDAWVEGKEWEGSYNSGPDPSWYEWTAPTSGLVALTSSISTVPEPDWYTDLLMTVFDSLGTDVSPGYDGNSIAYSGQGINNDETTTFTAVAGTTYYFMVESGDLQQGTFTWVYPTPPPNDFYADRITLTGDSGTATVDLTYATIEAGEPGTANKTAWYAWTPSADETIRWSVDRINRGSCHRLAVYTDTGSIPTDGDLLAQTNNAGTLHLDVVGGTNYIIRIELTSNTGRRPIDFHWLPYVPLDANSYYDSAATISGASGEQDFDGSDFEGTYHYYSYTPVADCVIAFWGDSHFELNYASADDLTGTTTVQADMGGGSFSNPLDHWSYDSRGSHVRAFELKGGQTYVIAFAANIAGRFFWGDPVPFAGSDFGGTGLYTGVRVLGSAFLGGQSLEVGETSPGIGTTAWARWTCPTSGVYELAVREPWWPASFQSLGHGPSRGLVARLGTGNSPATFIPLAVATSTTVDAAPDAASVLNRVGTAFLGVANTVYRIQLDAVDSPAALGSFAIKPLAPPPANDEPVAAVHLAGSVGSAGPMSTVNATLSNDQLPYPYSTYRDPDDPNSSGTTWYRFVGPPDVSDDLQSSTIFAFSDKTAGELTGWSIYVENETYKAQGYDISTPTAMNNLILVGGYSTRYQFRPKAGQVYWVSLTSRDAAAMTVHWFPGALYRRGPWIERPVEVVSAPYVTSSGGSRAGSWDQDQSFYDYVNGINAYTNGFARTCAFGHARRGEVGGFGEFGNSTSGFESICYPMGQPNASWQSYQRCGVEENWDTGGFLTAAFYNMTITQSRWLLDFYYALYGPPSPPTPPLGSITETEGVRHYSDQPAGSYSAYDPAEIPLYTLKQYDLQLSSFSVRADSSWTLDIRDASALADSTDQDNQFAFLQPGDEAALPLITSQVISGTADFVITQTMTDPTTYTGTIYQHPCVVVAGFASVATAGGPPPAVKALGDREQAQRAYFNASATNVHREPPRYRVLTPLPPNLTAAPGDKSVIYVPVHSS